MRCLHEWFDKDLEIKFSFSENVSKYSVVLGCFLQFFTQGLPVFLNAISSY